MNTGRGAFKILLYEGTHIVCVHDIPSRIFQIRLQTCGKWLNKLTLPCSCLETANLDLSPIYGIVFII